MSALPILSCVGTPHSPQQRARRCKNGLLCSSAPPRADLGSYRLAVRDTLLDQGVHPILQNHLEPDYQTLLDILRREINACDAVICLVGYVYGQEPKNRRQALRAAPIPSWSSTLPKRSANPSTCFWAMRSVHSIRTK